VLTKVARLFLILIPLLALLPGQAQALGIGVVPHELELEAYPLGSAVSSLKVLNPSDERAQFQVYVEGEYEEWFSITPKEFMLASQESQEVKIAISPSLIASGDHHASICVVSLISASELKVGTGVKIPVHIHIVAPPLLARMGVNATGLPLLVIFCAVALLLLALAIGIFIWRRRKSYET